MNKQEFRAVIALIGSCLIVWAIVARDHNYSPALWILIFIIVIAGIAREFYDDVRDYERGNAFIKGGIYPELHMIMESGDLTIVNDNDCIILDVAVDEYPVHLRSTMSKDAGTRSKGRYLLCEKIYNGAKYQYVSDVTHHSVKYLKLLLGSTQSFKLYVDGANPNRYYFETPF